DDDPVMRFLDPALTTFAVPHAAMGARAVAHLLALPDGNAADVLTGRTYVEAPLVERDSTCARGARRWTSRAGVGWSQARARASGPRRRAVWRGRWPASWRLRARKRICRRSAMA